VAVGVRELKNNLSRYLKSVKAGEKLAVTERDEIVAYVVPAGRGSEHERLVALVRDGKAEWKGGKPAGLKRRPRPRGKAISEIVLEERR